MKRMRKMVSLAGVLSAEKLPITIAEHKEHLSAASSASNLICFKHVVFLLI